MSRTAFSHAVGLGAIVLQLSCSNGSDAVSPGPAQPPAFKLAAASPTEGRGIVGSVVDDLPTVIAQDAGGAPIANVHVTFSSLVGNGVLIGTSVYTNASGIARPGTWVLGRKPGLNTVVASASSGLAVRFTRTTVAGPAAVIVKAEGDDQASAAGRPAQVRPRALITDFFGNPLPNVKVTFTVGVGGGSIRRSSDVTDSAGIATPGEWTLGAAPFQTLIASVEGLPPVTFTATAVDITVPCTAPIVLQERSFVHAELTQASCATAGHRYFNTYYVVLSDTTKSYSISASSTEFDTELELRDSNSNLVASNNDSAAATTNSFFRIIPAPGVYTVVAISHTADSGGAFDLNITPMSREVDGCEQVFVTRNIRTLQTANGRNCSDANPDSVVRFRIHLNGAQMFALHLQDRTYSGPSVNVFDPDGRIVASAIQVSPSDYDLAFTPAETGFHVIRVIGPDEQYTFLLTIK